MIKNISVLLPVKKNLLIFSLLITYTSIVNAATFTVSNVNDSGAGSLRQAILDSNASIGTTDTIVFNIASASKTIQPLTVLPTITDPVVIDGETQSGFNGTPLIVIDGSNAGAANGIRVREGGSTIRGLVINNFNGSGVRLDTNGGNTIEGNFIGTNAAGTIAQPNTSVGIIIDLNANGNNIIDNLVSGNVGPGIRIKSDSSNNVIKGNKIGTDATGTQRLGNGNNGHNVVIESSNNTIGGANANDRNIISGAIGSGVGVQITGNNNQLENNFIGTNINGNSAIPNDASGVDIRDGALNNTVKNNLISGNYNIALPAGAGILIANATQNKIIGNKIGTNLNGTQALGNFRGVFIRDDSSGNEIGGVGASDFNVISGNNASGVVLVDSSSNTVQGNRIGTDVTGNNDLGNGVDGVSVSASANEVSKNNSILNNVVSGNEDNGIILLTVGVSEIQIKGNKIGTNINGTASISNGLNGVSIFQGAFNNIVGGPAVADRNIISGNGFPGGFHGIRIDGNGTAGNRIEGNFIGIQADETSALANSGKGVFISNGAVNNSIGGRTAGTENTIAFNTDEGVALIGSGNGNLVVENSIFNNGGLGGIFLSGNSNNQQTSPNLTSSSVSGSSITVQGTLNSLNNTSFAIDFYSNESCDSSGNGEGQTHLKMISVNTGANGNTNITDSLTISSAGTFFITSTATDPNNNTSAFSNCLQVQVQNCSDCIFEDQFEN